MIGGWEEEKKEKVEKILSQYIWSSFWLIIREDSLKIDFHTPEFILY